MALTKEAREKLEKAIEGIDGTDTKALEAAIANALTPDPPKNDTQPSAKESEKKDEQKLSSEGEYFLRRIVEGVSKSVMDALSKTDDDDSPEPRRKRKPPEVKKKSFLDGLFS